MADIQTTHTYVTPGGTIVFNNGSLGDGTDKFWIHGLPGLDGPDVRAPIDDVPFGDGSLLHRFWLTGCKFAVEGVFIIETVPYNSTGCQAAINAMEAALKAAVKSNVAASGSWSFTPTGQGAISLTVFHPGQPKLDITPIENFATRSFTFGLISATAL